MHWEGGERGRGRGERKAEELGREGTRWGREERERWNMNYHASVDKTLDFDNIIHLPKDSIHLLGNNIVDKTIGSAILLALT